MKKRFVSMLIVLCMVFAMLPMTVQAGEPLLYKVKVENGAPYYATQWGTVVGKIPWTTVVQVEDIKQGSFAQVHWNGYLVYVWADNLKQVNAPDAVCSEWAQDMVTSMDGGYVGLKSKYPNVENDYTKPITRIEMAKMLMTMQAILHGPEIRKSDYPVVLKGIDQPLTDTDDRDANYLAKWGVFSKGRFRPNDIATYGEAVDAMVKLMAYDNTYFCKFDYGKSRTAVTKKMISTLGIGGNTSAKSPCTKEQFTVMSGKLACWARDYNLKWYAGDAKAKAKAPKKTTEGLFCIVSDTYTIQTALGKEGKHSYLNINESGKGELRSDTPQKFKITYLKTDLAGRSYTIQTMDGKYLAMDGMSINGSPLITRSEPYNWYISNGNKAYIRCAENSGQSLNAREQKSADGTAIITWDLTSTYKTGNENYKFIFEFAKK